VNGTPAGVDQGAAAVSSPGDLASLLDAVRRPAVAGPHEIEVPSATRLDPGYLFEVATVTNAAHAALGTELVVVAPQHAVVRLRRRAGHTEHDGTWAPGVIASLADHVCSFTGVVALGDPAHFGGTMSLRVEHAAPCASTWLVARAWARPGPGSVLRVEGTIHAFGQGTGGEAVVQSVAVVRASVVDLRLAP
jgi:acyl-coenzyme A thioesterase PaaI-like protein